MHPLLTFCISILEWFALLTFPFVFIGYRYRQYVKKIIVLSVIMSIISLLLHYTNLHLTIVIALQMILIFLIAKPLFKMSSLETLLLTGMGYGFYTFVHIVVIELDLLLLSNSIVYSEVLISNKIYALQLTSFFIVIALSLLIYFFKYHLTELFVHLKLNELNKKGKIIIYLNSFLTYFFICLASFVMVTNELRFRYAFILLSIVVLFMIFAVYLILHNQFQKKRLIEAKKFYFDQEEQVSVYIENIQKDLRSSYKVMQKLFENNSYELSKEYFNQHILPKSKKHQNLEIETAIRKKDELLYVFLINKRKLANLLGVSISTTIDLTDHVPITLPHIQFLSNIIDDLLFALYETTHYQDKQIHFKLTSTKNHVIYEIASNLDFDKSNSHSKIYDAIIGFKKNKAVIESTFNPLMLSISCEKLM
ncbi:hypothetical protein M3202_19115 [Alkalihalobacillus oceani]|uniref:Uncharacterized protein n=1 Tax=Halalkalibacter oceani TaxID=1653776 RepID=A0A9X2DVM6_9BACI|nr:hypothetical protein [Halalkalibacter oceani]MCM3716158.1 hypothetical protein [Halalkalibacter oceani]